MILMAEMVEEVAREKRAVRAKRRLDLKYKKSEQTDMLKWATVLPGHPEMKKYCPWGKFNGTTWAVLLKNAPQLADKCEWRKLRRRDWLFLLCAQPRFAAKCPCLDEFSARDWAMLLEAQDSLAHHCPWHMAG